MKKLVFVISVIIMTVALTLSVSAKSDDYVVFETDGLEEIVRETLNIKVNRRLRESDLLKVTELALSDTAMLADLNDIMYFKNLEKLFLDTQLDLKDLTGIENCAKLKELAIITSEVSDVSALSKIKTLEVFSVIYGSLEDITAVLTQPNLKSLTISNVPVDDIAALKGNKTLETLIFSGSELNNIDSLADIKTLKSLTLYNVKNIKTTDLAFIKDKKLETLELVNMGLENNIVNYIKNMQSLKYLDLSENNITKTAPLYDLKNIEVILADNEFGFNINVVKNTIIHSELDIDEQNLSYFLEILDILPDEILNGIYDVYVYNYYDISYYDSEFGILVLNNFDSQIESVLFELDGISVTEFDVNMMGIILDVLTSYYGYTDDEINELPYMDSFIEAYDEILAFHSFH